ncbi:hypothetical protein V7S43_003833 [Phytophthora oleae]|uniref:BZIP domain-containing protein n=1 Tax=Phytophthora oleae TaxID=2107226 RepID=A0ABD3FW35_9STRA
MNTSALFPPNRKYFSDAVIGTVVQRDQQFHDRKDPSPSLHFQSSLSGDRASPRRLPSLAKPQAPSGRVLSDALSHATTYSKTQKTRKASSTHDLDAKYVAEVELRRQRNRMHQARYKLKQRKLVADLESSVECLTEEVQELEMQHRLVSYGLPTNTTVWAVAAEFFRLFRHGVRGPVLKQEPSTSIPSQNQAQWDFVQSTMAADVTNGMVSGVHGLMENLVLQSRCYEEIDLLPLRMDESPGGSLIVSTKCELTITEGTLCYGFPNLVRDGRWSSLADMMFGQKISIQGTTRFVWDHSSGRVTRLEWKADLLTPLLRLLGSLEHVAQVFDGARITPDGLVKPRDSL